MGLTSELARDAEGKEVGIMGEGRGGIAGADEVRRTDVPVTVIEKDPHFVGGIARTVEHRGYRFDIGGHRFFSKSQEVEDLWTEILGDEMLTCDRLSRIYYNGKYFDYPLKATNALLNMGPLPTLRCTSSYVWARIRPARNPQSLDDGARNHLGPRLFSIYFKTYTEKASCISSNVL